MSFEGLCILYLGSILAEKKVSIAFNEKSIPYPLNTDYSYGIIVATSSIGLIKFNYRYDPQILTFESFNLELKKELITMTERITLKLRIPIVGLG